MDAKEYKNTGSMANVFSAGELEATVNCLMSTRPKVGEFLQAATWTLVAQPPRHRGGKSTERFRLDLSWDAVSEIVDALFDAEAGAVSPEGETTPEASRLGELVDRWTRYRGQLEELSLGGQKKGGGHAPRNPRTHRK